MKVTDIRAVNVARALELSWGPLECGRRRDLEADKWIIAIKSVIS